MTPYDGEPPAHGAASEVADGILWCRVPLPMAGLDHANIYALDEGTGWTLIDTGMDWKAGRAALAALRAGPLGGRPVERVVLTHHHPDHVGLAGRLVEEGAALITSRAAWLTARMLILDRQEQATAEQIAFRRHAGVTGEALAAYAAARPFNFADCVAPLPLGYRAVGEGEVLRLGGRDWQVRLGEGHAPEHVTLWTDRLVIAGDQVLPGISPNIGVYPTEPEADPLAGFLDTCTRFRALAEGSDPLVLPGHRRPFHGLTERLQALIDSHLEALERVVGASAEAPRSALDLFPVLFRRAIGKGEDGLALVESVAHLNHLVRSGRLERWTDAEGVWRHGAPGARPRI